jgi:hypothetical protein
MRVNIPKPILFSTALLLAAHAAGLWQMIFLSRTLGVPLWMPYGTLAFVYSLLMVLLVMVLRGKPWARALYTVLGALSLLSAVGHNADLSATGWLAATAKVVALVLLYVPVSNSWFARSSPNNSLKPTPLRGAA